MRSVFHGSDTFSGIQHARALLGDEPIMLANIDSLWLERGTPALETLKAAWNPERMDLLLLLVDRGNGIGFGDRVATLAWNTQAHVEAWYAIMGMGAVCHTLNPRLTAAQLASMLAQSASRVLFVSADLAPLAQQIVERTTKVTNIVMIDSVADAWRGERHEESTDGAD